MNAHLPNEIWLQIASYCEPRDIWLSLRPINHQLQDCAEQHFQDHWLPHITLALPIALPTYDIRNPIRGRALFHPVTNLNGEKDEHRVVYLLHRTEPEHYHSHFLGRWKGMCDSNTTWLNEKMKWEMRVGELCGAVKLKRPAIDQRVLGGEAVDYERFSFEWRASVTSFFRLR